MTRKTVQEVDFGLLDSQGNLIGNPVHYRDGRTTNKVESAFNKVLQAQCGI